MKSPPAKLSRRGGSMQPGQPYPTPLSTNDFSRSSISSQVHQCYLFHLPLEIRKQIYGHIAISRLTSLTYSHLWRPLSVDNSIHRIGYFDADTIIPLLLANHQLHDEVAAVLYGENVFAFHISGLDVGKNGKGSAIAWLDQLPRRYGRLLRKVFVRTGYAVHTPIFRFGRWDVERGNEGSRQICIAPRDLQLKEKHDLAVSIALMKQAWPKKYNIHINKAITVSYPADEMIALMNGNGGGAWPASTFHLWKLFVMDTDAETTRFEMRRVEWGSACVKNLGADGTRMTGGCISTIDQEP